MPQHAVSETAASLGSSKAAGGPTALKGFDFQRAYALTLLVDSLSDPAFNALIVEGAEDVELQFDKEGGIERRAVQVKGYRVTLGLAREIMADFHELDTASPGTWRSFVIACTGLDAKLQAIHNLLSSYRDPQGFYERGADGILANTRFELEQKLIAAGLPAAFIIERVSFEPGLPDLVQLEEWVRPRVLDALQRAQPEMTRLAAEDAYRRLQVLISESTRKALTREQAQAEIASAMEAHPAPAESRPRVVIEEEVETVERGAEHTLGEIGEMTRGEVEAKAKLGTVKGEHTGLKIDKLG